MWSQKTKNGKYQFFERYTDPLTGKKRVTSVTLKSNTNSARKQADKLLFQRIQQIMLERDYNYEITLEELKNEYIKWKYANLKEQSAISSETKLNKVIDILGGDCKVSSLSVRYVQEKLMTDSATKYNERLKHFKAMIRWGYHNDYLNDAKVADKLQPRKAPAPRVRNAAKYLEHDEIDILLNCFIPKWAMLTRFLILSGLRIGEALDLKKFDVDTKRREIRVVSSFSVTANKSSSTKTECSERVIFIQDELLKCVKDIRKTYHGKSPYFFEFGNLRSAYFSYNKYFKENTEKLLGRKLTPHCTRHTHTALMAEAGIPLQDISHRLGHANSRITQEIYLHFTNKMVQAEHARLKQVTLL